MTVVRKRQIVIRELWRLAELALAEVRPCWVEGRPLTGVKETVQNPLD